MPTLDQLKAKWFIPMDGSAPDGVPCRRHDGAHPGLSVSTDGNLITPLIDGAAYMSAWRTMLGALGSGHEFMHAGWRFQDVKTQGATVPGPHALENVAAAHAAGAQTYILMEGIPPLQLHNRPSMRWLHAHGVTTSCLDLRGAFAASNHHKFAVAKGAAARAVIGSIDISTTRWDQPTHLPVNADRDPRTPEATHDTGVEVRGPAVADIEITFRDRWNDPSRRTGLLPLFTSQPLISTPLSAPATFGTHSVQTLRTYGIGSGVLGGYSWAPSGEFTVWASYLNAIKRAQTYIYIEDQYFLPFDYPPRFSRSPSIGRDVDIVFQLGEAMKRGVRVGILTPSNSEDAVKIFQVYQRDLGVNYLKDVKTSLPSGSTGDVFVASLNVLASDVYIHSKLLIVDDEFVAIGSTNVGRRSMTCDGELHLGIVDGANVFAKELRKAIWAEHTTRAPASLDNPISAYTDFASDVAGSHGHLTVYPVDGTSRFPPPPGSVNPGFITSHQNSLRVIDPYAGPAALR